ncbi:MAG: AMP-binding protein [Steroidobacteraceae bacterium]
MHKRIEASGNPSEHDDDPTVSALDPTRVLPTRMAYLARIQTERIFLQEVSGPSLTFGECHDRMLRIAACLRQLGLQRGDRLLSFLPSSIDAHLLWMGSACAGVWEVSSNPELRGEFLRHILRACGARVCFARPEHSDVLAAARAAGLQTIEVDRGLPCLLDAPAHALERYPQATDVATVIYTSGTTGPAKGVILSWAQMNTYIGRIPRSWLSDADVAYSPWPMFHVTGRTQLITMADVGGRVVLREKPSVSEFWQDVRRHGCTTSTIAPILALLLAPPESPDDRDNPLRVCFGSTSGTHNMRCEERFGIRMVTSYGSTELGFPIVNRDINVHTMQYTGWLRAGYEARIVDEAGHELGPAEVGELHVRPARREMMMVGYLDQPEATAQAIVDGWYHTGDACVRDQHGGIRFVGRLRETIRRFGENISATALEAVILEDDGIAECCVVGVRSEAAGQEILLLVTSARDALSVEQLYARLAERLPRHMCPAYIRVVDALPKTPTGKVNKTALAHLAGKEGAWVSPASVERHSSDPAAAAAAGSNDE